MQMVVVTSVELCSVIYVLLPMNVQFKFQSPHQEAVQRCLEVHVQTPVASTQVSKLIKRKNERLWRFFCKRLSKPYLTGDVLWLFFMSSFVVLLLVKIPSPSTSRMVLLFSTQKVIISGADTISNIHPPS